MIATQHVLSRLLSGARPNGQASGPAGNSEVRAAAVIALAAFFWSRLAIVLVNWFSGRFLQAPIGDGLFGTLRDFGCRWDCGWYLTIANQGYSMASPAGQQPGATNLSFFPGYPYLVRLLSGVGDFDPMLTGMVISNIAFLLALFYLYRYCRAAGTTEQGASLAVLAAAFVPHSFVFSAFYAESVFFLTVTAACYHIRVGQYGRAGVAASLHTAIRPPGFLIMIFALASAMQVLGVRDFFRPWRDPRPFVPFVLAPLGLFMTWSLYYALTGDAFAHLTSSAAGWGRELLNPAVAIRNHFAGSVEDQFWVLGCLVASLSILILALKRCWPEVIYMAAVFLLLLSDSLAASLIRYTIVLPPLYLALGLQFGEKPAARMAVVGTLAMINAAILIAWNLSVFVSI